MAEVSRSINRPDAAEPGPDLLAGSLPRSSTVSALPAHPTNPAANFTPGPLKPSQSTPAGGMSSQSVSPSYQCVCNVSLTSPAVPEATSAAQQDARRNIRAQAVNPESASSQPDLDADAESSAIDPLSQVF